MVKEKQEFLGHVIVTPTRRVWVCLHSDGYVSDRKQRYNNIKQLIKERAITEEWHVEPAKKGDR